MRFGSLRMQSSGQGQLSSPGQKSPGRGTRLIDLPGPWLRSLVARKLYKKDCWALFCTSRGTAAAVARHCRCLTLRPSTTVIWNKHRRAFVLYLAARNNNLHLHAQGTAICLDIAVIWPCITQLTLDEVVINHGTCSSLQLQQLTRLHTLRLVSGARFRLEPILAVATLKHVVEEGGLPALRHLCCKDMYDIVGVAPDFVCQLAAILGDRITWLSVNNILSLRPVRSWPVLQRVQISDCPRSCSRITKQLLLHPFIRQISMPAAILRHAFSTDGSGLRSDTVCNLDMLEISGTVSVELLALLPLKYVRHLKLPGVITASPLMEFPALQNMATCRSMQVVPQPWQQLQKQYRGSSFQLGTSAIQAPLDAMMLGWLSLICSSFKGALILTTEVDGLGLTYAGRTQLGSIAYIPAGVHTLILDKFATATASMWTDVINCIPAHVQCLLLRDCVMSEADFREILDRPAPAGLTQLQLVHDCDRMPWIRERARPLRKLVSQKWPAVDLKLDLITTLPTFSWLHM